MTSTPDAAPAKPVPRPNADTRPFWDACNEGRLIYQHCRGCGRAQFYPRSACAACASADLEWRDARPEGTVHSFTVVHRAPSPAFRGDVPYVLALVDLADGFRMMLDIIYCDPETIRIGQRVRIVFEDRGGQNLPQATPAPETTGEG